MISRVSELTLYENSFEKLVYLPAFFEKDYFSALLNELSWKQNTIRVFEKDYPEPRLTAWYGRPYKYSNISWPEQDLTVSLKEINQHLTENTDFQFNSVLANLYRNGSDSMGWHSDNEPEMDTSLIASVSFGQERVFKLRNKISKEKIDIKLENNSILLMYNFQDNWQHSISKTKSAVGQRINLTFRNIIR